MNLRLGDEDRRLYAPVAAADLDDALVFVPPMWGPHLLHPFAWLQNDSEYNGETVYALDRTEPANLDLVDEYPGRGVYRLRVHEVYRADPPDPGLTTSLEPLTVLEREAFEATVALENPTTDPYVNVTVTANGKRDTFVLDTGLFRGSAMKRASGSVRTVPSSFAVLWRSTRRTAWRRTAP